MRLTGKVATLLLPAITGCFAAGTAQAMPGEPSIDPFALTRIERGVVLDKKSVRYGFVGMLVGAVAAASA